MSISDLEESCAQSNASLKKSGDLDKISIRTCLKNYYTKMFQFKTKATRKEFCVGVLYQWVMSIVFVLVVGLITQSLNGHATDTQNTQFQVFYWGWWLLIYPPCFSLIFRRSYDSTNKPYIAIIFLITSVFTLIAYTATFALSTFPPEYLNYFYACAIATLILFVSCITSWGILFFKKTKVFSGA